MLVGLRDILMDVAGDEVTTSIGADVAELSEGEIEETQSETEEQPPLDEPEVEVPEEQDVEELEVEEEEEAEIESEEEEQPESLDLHPFDRPTIKQLNEIYPDLFKKFPSLREMYFREAEYSKLFPTVDDAREANENNTAFNSIREDIFNGNGSKFFNAIKEVGEGNLEKFSSHLLPVLYQVHPQSFWRAANPLVEDIARNMFNKGVKDNNEDLQNAAKYLADYFFGSTEIAEGKKTSIVKDEVDPKLSEERTKFENEKETAFRGSIERDVRGKLLSMIEGKDPKTGKSRLDPDEVFSSFIKSTIIEHIITDLGSQLTSDKNHIRFMDSLWDKSRRNGRTDADKARIISAYLARAKSLIPTLRSKYVSEALGRSERSASVKRHKVEAATSRTDGGSIGRSSGSGKHNYNPKSIDYNKTSDADILNDNITYK